MSSSRLEKRVGKFRVGKLGILRGYTLNFNKKAKSGNYGWANLTVDPKSHVEGVLFELTEDQIKELDRCEIGYERKEVQVGEENVHTYIAKSEFIAKNLKPSGEYFNYLLVGAKEHGLSKEYIKSLFLKYPEGRPLS